MQDAPFVSATSPTDSIAIALPMADFAPSTTCGQLHCLRSGKNYPCVVSAPFRDNCCNSRATPRCAVHIHTVHIYERGLRPYAPAAPLGRHRQLTELRTTSLRNPVARKVGAMSADVLEFGAERRRAANPASIPRTRRQRRELVMDIVVDRRLPMFFCIVQQEGSPEILMVGQFTSRSEAVRAGEQFMSDYFRQQTPNRIAA